MGALFLWRALSATLPVFFGDVIGHQQRCGGGSTRGAQRDFGVCVRACAGIFPHVLLGTVRLLHRRRPSLPLRLPPCVLHPRLAATSRCLHGMESSRRHWTRGNGRGQSHRRIDVKRVYREMCETFDSWRIHVGQLSRYRVTGRRLSCLR